MLWQIKFSLSTDVNMNMKNQLELHYQIGTTILQIYAYPVKAMIILHRHVYREHRMV